MTKIDRVEDLPEWFDLKEYEGCKSFGAIQWHLELSRRASAFERISKGLEIEFSKTTQSIEEHKENTRRAAKYYVRPVRQIMTRDLACATYDYKGEQRPAVNWLLNEGNDSEKVSILEFAYMNSREVKIGNYPVLRVDLDATDEVLLDSFAAWLKEARAKKEFAPQRKKKLYTRWASYGLLPYLDLHIWERSTGNHIPRHVIATAVGYAKGESSFSKTVVPLAADLMRDLSEIAALAAVESETFAS